MKVPSLAFALVLSCSATVRAQCRTKVNNPSIELNGQWTTTIMFATLKAGNSAPIYLAPQFAIEWIKKNAKKYPGICFTTSTTPIPGTKAFEILFSATAQQTNGFQPVTRTSTSTNATPISGNGTVTDQYGNTADYTYSGTETTTTTTTTTQNTPYAINNNALVVTVYGKDGQMLSQREHVYSTQSGGDPNQALGHNLGNLIAAAHAKSKLLKKAVEDCIQASSS